MFYWFGDRRECSSLKVPKTRVRNRYRRVLSICVSRPELRFGFSVGGRRHAHVAFLEIGRVRRPSRKPSAPRTRAPDFRVGRSRWIRSAGTEVESRFRVIRPRRCAVYRDVRADGNRALRVTTLSRLFKTSARVRAVVPSDNLGPNTTTSVTSTWGISFGGVLRKRGGEKKPPQIAVFKRYSFNQSFSSPTLLYDVSPSTFVLNRDANGTVEITFASITPKEFYERFTSSPPPKLHVYATWKIIYDFRHSF